MEMDLESILRTSYLTVEQGEYLIATLITNPDSWGIFLKLDRNNPSIVANTILKVMKSRGIRKNEYYAVADEILLILQENDFQKLRQCKRPETFWGYFGKVVNTSFAYNYQRKGEFHRRPNKVLSEFVRSKGDVTLSDELLNNTDTSDVLYDMINEEQQKIQERIFMSLSPLDLEILTRKYSEEEKTEAIARDLFSRGLITSKFDPPSDEWLKNINHTVDERAHRAKERCKKMQKKFFQF